MHSTRDHWNQVFQNKPETTLSWYEAEATPSLEMVKLCSLKKKDLVVDVGSGLSHFLDDMWKTGYQNLAALDISEAAVEKAKERLGVEIASSIKWFIDDVTYPQHFSPGEPVSLWHDRAVFHFLTKPEEQALYLQNLDKNLALGGNVILATHAPEAPETCSSLPVICYDKRSLTTKLGNKYMLLYHFYHQHHTPAGQSRKFLYALFQKIME